MNDYILIISNENEKLFSYSDIFRLKNIQIIKSNSIDEAINILKDNKDIGLIITYYIIGDKTAFEIIDYLNSDLRFIPVVAILKEEQKTLKTQAFVDGVCAVYTEPFSESYLLINSVNLLNISKNIYHLKTSQNIIEILSKTIEYRDTITIGHAKRAANLSIMLYNALGFNDSEQRYKLYVGALLHDIGKIGIPDSVLFSTSVFDRNSNEYKMLKEHPKIGFEIAKNISDNEILDIILHHHERLDGSGYPEGLLAKDLSTLVKIVAVVDIFDSVIHERLYRKERTIEEAKEILKKEALEGKISYDITTTFIKLIDNIDVYSL